MPIINKRKRNVTKFKIEVAELDHIEDLLELEKICFSTNRLSKKQMRYLINASSADVLVVKKQNSIIAYAIILYRKNSKFARLYSIAVNPNFQRLGIAKRILECVEQHVKKRHRIEIRLEVNKNNQRALHFYQKHGYKS